MKAAGAVTKERRHEENREKNAFGRAVLASFLPPISCFAGFVFS